MTVAPMAPGVRAARERVGLTQEQVAEQANMSIHTFRRWDRGRHRPGSPEQMQLLAMILKTPIEVLWPPRSNPQVALASTGDAPITDVDVVVLPGGIDLGGTSSSGTDSAPVGWSAATGDEKTTQASPASFGRRDVEPIVPAKPPVTVLRTNGRQGRNDGLVNPTGLPYGLAGEPGYEDWDETPDVPSPGSIPPAAEAGRTLRGSRPSTRWSWRRAVAAVTVAGVLGVGAMVAASAVGDRQGDAKRAAAMTTVKRSAEQQAAQQRASTARRRSVARMQASEQRGDYDAAIAVARQLDDRAALDGYRAVAAKILVGRAEQAAHRGDLSLARSRLNRAQERYNTAPGASKVRARIRRIEQQRAVRATQRRDAARRAATVATPAVPAPSPTEDPVTPAVSSETPGPSSSTPAPSSSSKGTGGSSRKDPNKAVDPGLF